MPDGTIKSYQAHLGNGMIKPSDQSRDVYFNEYAVEGGDAWVVAGTAVTYELYNRIGDPQAKFVKRR